MPARLDMSPTLRGRGPPSPTSGAARTSKGRGEGQHWAPAATHPPRRTHCVLFTSWCSSAAACNGTFARQIRQLEQPDDISR